MTTIHAGDCLTDCNTCAGCVKEMKIAITCDICGVKSKDYSNGGFWNCLCETCWTKEKDLI